MNTSLCQAVSMKSSVQNVYCSLALPVGSAGCSEKCAKRGTAGFEPATFWSAVSRSDRSAMHAHIVHLFLALLCFVVVFVYI